MNILFFCSRFPGMGGIEKVTEYLANWLSKRYPVTIFSLISQHKDALLSNVDKGVNFYCADYDGNRGGACAVVTGESY